MSVFLYELISIMVYIGTCNLRVMVIGVILGIKIIFSGTVGP